MRERLASQGTCSIVAVVNGDGDENAGRPVGQLYVRAYARGFRSPAGLRDGSWWADLKGVEGVVSLPERTAMLGCWHVGRVRDREGRESEAPEYRGQGVGLGLLRGAVEWMRSGASPFEAVAFKSADCAERPYLEWLGGLPWVDVEPLGFERLALFEDPYLVAEPEAPSPEARVPNAARFHLVVMRARR